MQTKIQKQKVIDELKEKVDKQKAMVFFDFTGMKVKDIFGLRKKLKSIGGELKITKKTLMGLVFKNKVSDFDPKKLKGEIALAFGYNDEFSSAKAVYQLSQQNQHLKILGGILENKFIESEKVIELANLPTREVLLARLAGSVASPISGLLNVFNGNIKGLIFALNAIKNNK